MSNRKNLFLQDSDQVLIIFSKVFGIVALSTLILQLMRSGDKSETWDKLIFATAIVVGIAGFVAIFLLKIKSFRLDLITLIAAFAGILLGVGGIEEHDPINGVVLSNRLWLGFGPFALALLLAIALIVWKVWDWQNLNKAWKALLSVIALAATSLASLSFFQDAKSIIDPDHSEYVLNEVMAIRAGNWPFESFIPQYQTVYTFFAALFTSSDTDDVAQSLLFLMVFATFAAIAIGVILVRQTLPSKAIVPAILLVVPFTAVTQFPIREGFMGSIASLLSGLSIRILPGVLLFALVLWVVTSPRMVGNKSRIAFFILGIVTGWTMWSSQDFGIAATVTTFIILSIIPFRKGISKVNSLIFLASGFIPGFLTYQVISLAAGKSINYDYFAFFARQFGSGFGAENMRTPGPVLVILPLIIALAVAHLLLLRISQNLEAEISSRIYSNSVLGLLFASWSTLGFSYYLNRSYASGQMQILFLPIAISLGTLVGSLLYLRQKEDRTSQEFSSWALVSTKARHSLVVTLVISLPLSTLLLLPNPSIELDRINQGNASPRWPKPTITASISDARAGLNFARANNATIAFFGASSNYVSDATGIESAAILNSPFDLYMSQETVTVTCEYLEVVKPDYLILSDEGAALFQFENQTLCGTYAFADISGVRSGRAAKRI